MTQYEKFVASRCKPGEEICIKGNDAHLVHMLIGLIGELGELADCLKRYLIYGQPMDVDNADEEAGDLEFYMAGWRNGMIPMGGSTRQDILSQNVKKLLERYPEGYSDQSAAERADKNT